MRTFRTFRYKDASYRISLSGPENISLFDCLTDNIKAVRSGIEAYIERQPVFLSSLEPVELLPGAPEAVILMADAAKMTGLGPMAAVAGTIAQCAAVRTAEIAAAAGCNEIIIENGGDIYISRTPLQNEKNAGAPVTMGIFSGLHSKFSSLALLIPNEELPVSVCSSSGRMGHSLSLGDCDLSTVISDNAAIADAAATLGGNLVKKEEDLGPAAERIAAIADVRGVILIKNQKIAMAGKLPKLIKHNDGGGLDKITITGKEY